MSFSSQFSLPTGSSTPNENYPQNSSSPSEENTTDLAQAEQARVQATTEEFGLSSEIISAKGNGATTQKETLAKKGTASQKSIQQGSEKERTSAPLNSQLSSRAREKSSAILGDITYSVLKDVEDTLYGEIVGAVSAKKTAYVDANGVPAIFPPTDTFNPDVALYDAEMLDNEIQWAQVQEEIDDINGTFLQIESEEKKFLENPLMAFKQQQQITALQEEVAHPLINAFPLTLFCGALTRGCTDAAFSQTTTEASEVTAEIENLTALHPQKNGLQQSLNTKRSGTEESKTIKNNQQQGATIMPSSFVNANFMAVVTFLMASSQEDNGLKDLIQSLQDDHLSSTQEAPWASLAITLFSTISAALLAPLISNSERCLNFLINSKTTKPIMATMETNLNSNDLEPVFKVAEASKEQGAPARRPAVYRDILEDESTGATLLFAASVDCEDRFLLKNEERYGPSASKIFTQEVTSFLTNLANLTSGRSKLSSAIQAGGKKLSAITETVTGLLQDPTTALGTVMGVANKMLQNTSEALLKNEPLFPLSKASLSAIKEISQAINLALPGYNRDHLGTSLFPHSIQSTFNLCREKLQQQLMIANELRMNATQKIPTKNQQTVSA